MIPHLYRLAIAAAVAVSLAIAAPSASAADHAGKESAPSKAGGAVHGDPKPAAHEPEGPITWDRDLALWSGVTFVLFLFVLGKLAWAPIVTGLDKREANIRGNIANAEAVRLKAESMLAEHASRMSKVQDEVREILAEARRDAERTKQEIVAEAQKEANASKQRAIVEIGRARDSAIKDVFDTMAAQVASATEHVLGRTVQGSDQERLIDEALAQFPRH